VTKQEFQKRFKAGNFNMGEYIVVTDSITDEPLVIGCAYEQGIWKVFQTFERGGHYIIEETNSENDAFDLLYELILSKHKRYS
jgi:hypothetical protein